MSTTLSRFLDAMRESHRAVRLQHYRTRSTERNKVIYRWIKNELEECLPPDFSVRSMASGRRSTCQVRGKYINKRFNVIASRSDRDFGVVRVRHIGSNYRQNARNYFDGTIGETTNIHRVGLVYGFFLCGPASIPYLDDAGNLTNTESLRDNDVDMYRRLMEDTGQPGTPDAMGIGIVDMDVNDEVDDVADPHRMGFSRQTARHLRDMFDISGFFPMLAEKIQEKAQSSA